MNCANCGDGSGWSAWYPLNLQTKRRDLLWVARGDCNDEEAKPQPKKQTEGTMKAKTVKELKAALKESQAEAAEQQQRLEMLYQANEGLSGHINSLMQELRQEKERVNGLD